jgi:hypothetical protein
VKGLKDVDGFVARQQQLAAAATTADENSCIDF